MAKRIRNVSGIARGKEGQMGRKKRTKGGIQRARTMILLTMRSILLDRKTMVVAVILLILLAIPLLWLHETPEDPEAGEAEAGKQDEIGSAMDVFMVLVVFVYLQFLVLYVCFLYGSGLITTEVDDHTITYLISRPLAKSEILICKYFGYVISIFLLFAIPTLLNYLLLSPYGDSAGLVDYSDLLAFSLGGILIGVMVWGAYFMFMASVFKNPLMPGFLYCIFWESFIANIGVNISTFTVTYQIRTFIIRGLMKKREYMVNDDDLPPYGDYSAQTAFFLALITSAIFMFLAWNSFRKRDMT